MHVVNPADTSMGKLPEGSEGESLLVTDGLCRGPQDGRFLAGESGGGALSRLDLPAGRQG